MFKNLKERLSTFKNLSEDDLFEEGGPVQAEQSKPAGKPKGKAKTPKPSGPKPNEGRAPVKVAKKVKAAPPEPAPSRKAVVDHDSGIGRRLSKKKVENILWDLEMILLESDVALPVAEQIQERVKERLLTSKVERGRSPGDIIEKALKDAILDVITQKTFSLVGFVESRDKPVVLMFVGVNGTGKTTAIARLVHKFKSRNLQCVMAAADTFRAGAVEQLGIHADNLGVKLIKHGPNSDPAAVAFDAVEHAKARHKDIVLIDTAGRMQTNVNLMDEMRKIKRISKPDMIIFVGDALTGNDAVIQATKFDEAVGVDAVILTKIDADAKGGGAISMSYTINKPIIYVGVGQEYDDLQPFSPTWLVERMFDQ